MNRLTLVRGGLHHTPPQAVPCPVCHAARWQPCQMVRDYTGRPVRRHHHRRAYLANHPTK